MRRVLLLASVAGLLLALLWLLRFGGTPSGAPGPQRESTAQQVAAPPAGDPAGASSAAARRQALEPDPADPTATTLVVQVVDAPTYAPFVPAQLHLLPAAAVDDDWDELLARFDQPTNADLTTPPLGRLVPVAADQSRFEIHVTADRAALLALAPGHRGFVTWTRGANRALVLPMWPLLDLEVQVFDAHERPAPDVEVGLSTSLDVGSWSARSGRTDLDGRYRFTGLDPQFAMLAAKGNPAWLHARLIGHPHEPVAVPLDPWPAQPIPLHLREAGTVVVRVRDAGTFSGYVGLTRVVAPEVRGSRGTIPAGGAPLVDGEARFLHVTLGATFKVSVRMEGWYGSRDVETAGPSLVGELREIPVELAAGPCVTGILAGADGQVLRSRSWFFSPLTGGFNTQMATDDEGRFRLLLADSPWWWQVFTFAPDEPQDLDPAVRGVLDLSAGVPHGWTDVGRILVAPPPVVMVAGTVVDEQGLPLDGAWICVAERYEDHDGEVWWEEDLRNVVSGADGRFEIHAVQMSASLLRLQASKDGWMESPPLEVPAGRRDAMLRLRRAASFEAKLTVDERLDAWHFGLELRERGTADSRSSTCNVEDDVHRASEVLPGRYDVAVLLEDSPEPLLVVEDVELVGGATTRDPRLWPADVRDAVRFLRLSVVDGDGQPFVEEADFEPQQTADATQPFRRECFRTWRREGPSTYTLGLDARWEGGVVVTLGEMLPELLPRPADGDVVQLRPAPVVGLRLESPVAPTPSGRVARVEITGTRSAVSDPRFRGVWPATWLLDELDGRDTLRLRFRLPGRYRVTWQVSQQTPGEPAVTIVRALGPPLDLDLSHDGAVLALLLLALPQVPAAFGVQVVDRASGRGVPLVELKTVNGLAFVTDSAGWAAILEPGLMGESVWFTVSSHGYEFPADGFGFRGTRLAVAPGGRARLEIDRLNLAERLYRVTGEGIYRDSVLLGEPVPLARPLLAGGVHGQDSVLSAVYRGRIFWIWGDTNRAAYPLGNFHASGARSELPGAGGLDPALGIDLDYFTGTDGFSRGLCPMAEPGPVWLDGLSVLRDATGAERLLARFMRVKDLGTLHEQGFVIWNDERQVFEKAGALPLDAPLHPLGHPTPYRDAAGADWLLFCNPFPAVRVPATIDAFLDPNAYQGWTCLAGGTRWPDGGFRPSDDVPFDRDAAGRLRWSWKPNTAAVDGQRWAELVSRELAPADQGAWLLADAATGERVLPHGGTLAWNDYRGKWISILLQSWGKTMVGEVWYAETDDPWGAWSPAVKIVTHDRYSFYNVRHHPFLDQQGGRLLYFEGTYTASFSGNDHPTPRYDYNQVMYRLDLGIDQLRGQTSDSPPPEGG